MRLIYTNDICGNEILQDETEGHQVMMACEKPYMEACIDKLDISGSVLEIGFGLGYSATKICLSPDIKEYSVIECSPVVWSKIDEFKKQFSSLKINLIKGRWQDVLCICKKYDRCFFNDYIYDIHNPNKFQNFISDFLPNHANINCILGAYTFGHLPNINIPFVKMECEQFIIDIPKYCKYARGDKLYITKLVKEREPTIEESKKLKEIINDKSTIKMVDGVIKTTENLKFTIASSKPKPTISSKLNKYNVITEHYFKKDNMKKLNRLCDEYISLFTQDNRELRLVKFYCGYANYYINPVKSHEIFTSLLSINNLDTDIEIWILANIQ